MGRPTKEGLDYFELDCHVDEKIRLIEAEFGLKGFAIIIKLYQHIYSGHGYYCEWNPDISLLLALQWCGSSGGDFGEVGKVFEEGALSGFPKNLINEVVTAAIRRNIFSEKLFTQYRILTSAGIQKRYINATAKRSNSNLKKEHLLLSDGSDTIFTEKTMVSEEKTPVSASESTQSKGKESKGNKRRVNKSKGKKIREEKKREENRISSSLKSASPIRKDDLQRIVDAWNSIGISNIVKVSTESERYRQLKARVREYGVDAVVEAINKIPMQPFLMGDGNKGWTITFDWFVKPNNFPKVLEGNYASHTARAKATGNPVQDWLKRRENEDQQEEIILEDGGFNI